jgi:16S rRNA (guanine527-N7)-methyltransferase
MSDVSRETSAADALGPPPASVVTLAGQQEPLLQRYAAWLATEAVPRGLIGPREVPRLWDRHILNCLVITSLVPAGSRVADVGSGAGLPGLVLAIVRPDLRVVLIEPLLRRTAFLDDVVVDLALPNTEVHRGRAEHFTGAPFDVVVSRAVAPLGRLLSWCMPLVRPHGELLALKGATAAAEVAQSRSALHSCGASSWSVRQVGADYVDPPTTVVRVVAGPARR